MSTQRACHFWKATNNNWYIALGTDEQLSDDDPDYEGENDDSVVYGPFASFEAADHYLSKNHSNPGGFTQDDSGTGPVPTDAVSPSAKRKGVWGR